MLEQSTRQPLIVRFYYRFVEEGNAADFIRAVSTRYLPATLHRLAESGNRPTRRASVLALTLLGHQESIAIVGRSLHDEDRGVRMIAEQGLPAMWHRAGSFEQCQMLQTVMRLNAMGSYADAVKLSDALLGQNPEFGEAWHQRSEALMGVGEVFEAITNNQRALECEPYHFPAALELAQCYLELGDVATAVSCLQWVLQIHPHYELARVQLLRLQRDLREQTDC